MQDRDLAIEVVIILVKLLLSLQHQIVEKHFLVGHALLIVAQIHLLHP